MEDVFRLNPPRTARLATNKSAQLFQRFLINSGLRWPSTTQQGLYVMTPNGGFLYGRFAASTNVEARDVMIRGWRAWQKSGKNSWAQDIPETKPERTVTQSRDGYLKLRVAYRDLPRGSTKTDDKPALSPYNLGWYGVKDTDAHSLVEGKTHIWRRLVLSTMKDAVRGQMPGWSSHDWRNGHLSVTPISNDGVTATFRIQSQVVLSNSRTYFAPNIFGEMKFDLATHKCTDLQIVAVGQRGGKGAYNDRLYDSGYAPMGVAIRMVQ